MKLFFTFFISVIVCLGFSQNKTKLSETELYENYREDQFYAGVTYNLLNNKPKNLSQSGFSSGFHFGFIRDMPINERRNVAFGIGLGLSANSYNQNLLIEENNSDILYTIINESEINVSKNKFTTYLVEVPLEFRWRTSTASEYSFWRIYTGLKLGYLLYNSTKFKSSNGGEKLRKVDDFNKLQYGLTFSAGYGTWNFHLYYGLNTIFNDNAKLNSKSLDLKAFKLGLMFYIL